MPTIYPNIRVSLSPSFANASDSRIQSLLQSRDIDAEAMEGFFDDLGKFASGAAKVAAQVAPAVLPVAGTVLGTVVGGPAGAALGGTLGSLAGKAIGAATGQAGPGPAPPTAAPTPGAGGGVGGGSPAAGQLLQTLLKPQTVQALTSMALGSVGTPNVQVGNTPVPVTAFTNLLGMLAGRAESEYNASVASTQTSVPGYMRDYAGLPKGDPAVAQHRAEALYELLESSESEQESTEAVEAEGEGYESEMESLQAEYDAVDMAELYEFETEEA